MLRPSHPRLRRITRVIGTFHRSPAARSLMAVVMLAASTVAQLASTGGTWPS